VAGEPDAQSNSDVLVQPTVAPPEASQVRVRAASASVTARVVFERRPSGPAVPVWSWCGAKAATGSRTTRPRCGDAGRWS